MKEKAIIILPGIMGSNLYDSADMERLWPKFDFGMSLDEMSSQGNMVDFAHLEGAHGAYHWVDRMSLDEDGTPLYDGVVTRHTINMEGVDDSTQLGSNNEHRKLYTTLYKAFYAIYDVILYEYDWRLDNAITALELEKYIDKMDYESVILVCHSMGGIIADEYLMRNSSNRSRVKKLITLGTPHLGAASILAGLENPLAITGFDDVKMTELHRLIDSVNGSGACDEMLSRIIAMVHNTVSVYDLLSLLSMYEDTNGDINVTSLDEWDEYGLNKMEQERVVAFLKTRPWMTEKHVKNIISGRNSKFIEGKHVTELVDTTYIGGRGIATKHSLRYTSIGDMDVVMSRAGDRVVTAYSATLGKVNDNKQVFLIDNCTHADLLAGDTSVNKVVEIITNIDK